MCVVQEFGYVTSAVSALILQWQVRQFFGEWSGNEEMVAERLRSLDSLRGIAAIGVAVFWHYQHFRPAESPFFREMYWFYQYGWICVDFFFVLSGFVFSYVYGKRILEHGISWRHFAMLRISRLYPVFLVTTLLVAILQGVRHGLGMEFFIYPCNDAYHFLLNLVFLHSGWFEHGFSFNAPSWSVACEVTVYAIFFAILYWQGKQRGMAFAAMVFLGLFLERALWEFPLLNTVMARAFLGFFMGCLTYLLHGRLLSAASSAKRRLLYLWLAAILLLCAMAAHAGHGLYGEHWQDVYVLILFPSAILFALHLPWFSRVLSLRPLTFLGDISYSVYLWHFPVQLILVTGAGIGLWFFDPARKWGFFLYIVLTFLAGAISHHYEAKAQKWIRRKFSRQ